jgi:hypothetical protein
LLCIVIVNHKNAKPMKMKTNPHYPTGFGSYSDRALAETATAFYHAISNNTELSKTLPGLEAFNATLLAFLEALEKGGSYTRNDVVAKNAHRHKLAIALAALKEYAFHAPRREAVKLEKPAFFNLPTSRPQPMRPKPRKVVAVNPGQLLLGMFLKMIHGMRSYWHAAGSNPHL